jgi:ketosteroid isomerase-like protein
MYNATNLARSWVSDCPMSSVQTALRAFKLRGPSFHRITGFCFFIAVSFSALLRADTALPVVELPDELDRVLVDYENAWAARDGAALADLFTEDGYVLPNGRLPVEGQSNIEAYYSESGGQLHLHAFDYAISGNVGFIIGGFTYGDRTNDLGKFTLTLKKNDEGIWKIHSDMDNPNFRRNNS